MLFPKGKSTHKEQISGQTPAKSRAPAPRRPPKKSTKTGLTCWSTMGSALCQEWHRSSAVQVQQGTSTTLDDPEIRLVQKRMIPTSTIICLSQKLSHACLSIRSHWNLILRHAWLNLWDKHMTTGRMHSLTYFVLRQGRVSQQRHQFNRPKEGANIFRPPLGPWRGPRRARFLIVLIKMDLLVSFWSSKWFLLRFWPRITSNQTKSRWIDYPFGYYLDRFGQNC